MTTPASCFRGIDNMIGRQGPIHNEQCVISTLKTMETAIHVRRARTESQSHHTIKDGGLARNKVQKVPVNAFVGSAVEVTSICVRKLVVAPENADKDIHCTLARHYGDSTSKRRHATRTPSMRSPRCEQMHTNAPLHTFASTTVLPFCCIPTLTLRKCSWRCVGTKIYSCRRGRCTAPRHVPRLRQVESVIYRNLHTGTHHQSSAV